MTDGRPGVGVHGAAVFVHPCVGGAGATFIPSSDHVLDPEICEGIAMLQLPVLNNQRSGAIGGFAVGGRGGERGRSVDDGTRARLAKELGALLEGTGSEVRFGTHDRLLYATDASLYQEEPIGVVIPASVQDAARVVGWCHREGVAVLPRGGGTSLAGQCTSHAVVIDCSPNCRAVGEVKWDREASVREAKARAASGRGTMPGAWEGAYVEVEPGCTVDELNEELVRRGEKLFFAPDPATSRQAAIGGCLGNNAAGSRSVRYGRTSENVLAIEAAIPALGGERVWLEAGAPRASAVAARVTEVVARHAAEIRARFPKTIRRNAGYGLDMVLAQMDAGVEREGVSLTPLLCGSEGTLALTTRARVKLMPTPSAKGLMVVSFATLEHAIAAVKPILDRGVAMGLSAVELLDDVVLDAARGNIQYRKYVELLPGANEETRDPKAVLYIEFFAFDGGSGGATPNAQLEQGFVAIADVLRSLGDDSGVIPNGIAKYTDTGAMLKAWALRKAGEPLLHGLPGARKPITFVEDNAVPVERLSEFVRRFKEIVGRHGTRAAYWAHASVGVLHVRPMIDLHDPADRERMVAIAVEVADLARDCGGVMSGEHGDGKVRGPLIERFFGPELVRAFREVKQAFDPKGIMNPGNIVGPYGAPETIASGLRVDAARGMESLGEASGHDHDTAHAHGHHTHHADGHAEGESGTHASHREQTGIDTYFDYADQHGFGHAVEMCNGAGVCRKRSGGTMCPSYMATQDERHSTRGRGNALRLAMSGQVNLVDRDGVGIAGRGGGAPVFDDAETIETLHLCLSCKACKSECPSNVDIARLKAEYTAQRYKERGGASLIAKLFGHVRTLNRLGSLTPGLTNWMNGLPVTKAIARRVMGIDERRSLPRFERSLWARLRDEEKRAGTKRGRAADATTNDDQPVVVLYADCFTAYNEPHIGVAAVRVLEAFGYRVRVLPNEGTLLDGEWGGSGCCGRAMISTGLLPEAIRTADSTLEILREATEDPNVRAVVVCEPSCLSAIKDDWLQLKLSTPMRLRKALAAKSFLVEEFLEKSWNAHPKRPEAAQGDKSSPVLLHAHCHQKALWGAESSAGILRRLVGDRLKVLDTGCCGMAGSFGFTADRYDLSQRIGELSLMPALRGAAEGAKVCAPGTSCRHQIHDAAARGTGGAGGKHADHPVQVIAEVLGLR